MRTFPIFIDVSRTLPMVAGGGTLAAAKVRTLLQRAPRVAVAADALITELQDLNASGKVEWLRRSPTRDDIQGRPLLVSALDDNTANKRIADLAHQCGVPVNVPDRPELCSFAFSALVNRGDLAIAIGTDGAAPILATNLRAWLERKLHPRLGRLAAIARDYRVRAARLISPGASRRAFWDTALSGAPADAILTGNEQHGRRLIDRLLAGAVQAPPEGRLILVGAGPGDPELLTLKALRALKSADIILHDRLVSREVLDCARREAEIVEVGKRKGQRSTPQSQINALIVAHARAGRIVVRLKGGDPSIFGRAAEELATAQAAGIETEILAGITTAQATAAELKLPLTSRGNIRQFSYVAGTFADNESDLDWSALTARGQAFAIYMGMSSSTRIAKKLLSAGADPATRVVIVENTSRPNQRAVTTDIASLPRAIANSNMTGPAILMIGLDWDDMHLRKPDWVEDYRPTPIALAGHSQAIDTLQPRPSTDHLPIAV